MAKLLDVLSRRVEEIKGQIIVKKVVLNGWSMKAAKHLAPGKYEFLDADWKPLNVGDIWARQGQTVFMRRKVQIPADWAGMRVGLTAMTGGEGLLSIDGQPFHGVDDNRGYILLNKSCQGGESYDCEIEIKTGNYFEYVVTDANQPYLLSECNLIAIDPDIEAAYYDFKVVHEAAASEKNTVLQEAILLAIKDVLHTVDFRDKSAIVFKEKLQSSRALLWDKLGQIKFGDTNAVNFLVGHSHIDVAWLWPLKETMRKVGRTYSTVTALMDEYPDYHFVCSQVPLFLYLKQYFPSVYEKVKARVAEGRFEPIGGTWVENDCNVVSGESLVRQCLYGQRFFRDEFGADVRVGWLPDVFGYSWAMPQIYKKSGLDYFMTSKIRWNDTNRFPYQTFWWQGIDGTKIFTHFIHGEYNAAAQPAEIRQFWDDYRSKLECPEFISSYGWGDGGGGPTRKNMEYLPRMANIPGLAKARTGRAHDFFDRIASETENLPTWNGEFYFELHRGTYTSQARNKRYNRMSELLYRDAEMYNAIGTTFGAEYPKQDLVSGWQTILLNQFHDIIPGSSINEVYKVSTVQYEELLATGSKLRASAIEMITDKIDTSGEGTPVVVFNSLSWPRKDIVSLDLDDSDADIQVIDSDGSTVPHQISGKTLTFISNNVPSCGYSVYRIADSRSDARSPFTVDGETITTPYYELTLAGDGTLTRLYDRINEREVLPAGARSNVLQVFEDKPSAWDAWDIELQYQDKVWEFTLDVPPIVLENGPVRLVLGFTSMYGASTIDQQVILYTHSPRIDFVSTVDWNERQTLLKVAFPVDVNSTSATYEIAFGAVERPTHWNTSWDKARFEVSGHRWADLSEPEYGVSLLNDCKYGWDIKDNVMRLTLLRAPESPDPEADRGVHEFTYSLLPHAGDWKDGTVQAGQELNAKLQAVVTKSHGGDLPASHSFVSVDRGNVIIDTVKQAEDSDDLIVRVYEAYGARGPVRLSFDRMLSLAAECNLLEEEDLPVEFSGSEIKFSIKPFEIRTFKVKLV